MKVDVILGLQWGDEGKGKIVDYLTPAYDIVARFQGGPNAGHSLEFNNQKHVLHSIPSGIFHPSIINIIGNGVVLDPVAFKKEVDELKAHGLEFQERLKISKKAHLILPSHRILDAASEASKGKTKIGSTLKGIGPAYMDKTGRNGLRVGDILMHDFIERYDFLKMKHMQILKQYDFKFNIAEFENDWFEGIEMIKKFELIDSEYELNTYLNDKKMILAEGAQGTMLDIDFGSYPFVTSSNTISAGLCTGLGIAPSKINDVLGIFKAYCTRVGSGPFPTELDNATGQEIQRLGREVGATTGRPRRCGWIDLVALKYAVMISGVSKLIMTKVDILSHFDEIYAAVSYKIGDKQTDRVPFEISTLQIEPIYKKFKGWKIDVMNVSKYNDLPAELIDYIRFIEDFIGVPIAIISVGPDREQTIIR